MGNAVSRNRAKRLLREAYRRHKHRIPARGVNLVLVARHGCAESGFRPVEADFLNVLTRAGFGANEDGAPGPGE